jgi:hypothetical protein
LIPSGRLFRLAIILKWWVASLFYVPDKSTGTGRLSQEDAEDFIDPWHESALASRSLWPADGCVEAALARSEQAVR